MNSSSQVKSSKHTTHCHLLIYTDISLGVGQGGAMMRPRLCPLPIGQLNIIRKFSLYSQKGSSSDNDFPFSSLPSQILTSHRSHITHATILWFDCDTATIYIKRNLQNTRTMRTSILIELLNLQHPLLIHLLI